MMRQPHAIIERSLRIGTDLGKRRSATPQRDIPTTGKRTHLPALCISFAVVFALALAGCASDAASTSSTATSTASGNTVSATHAASLAPGTYTAEFNTDSSMFHVNEADGGLGELTVEDDGSMSIHVSLVSKKIVNLYPGTADEARQPGATLLEPTIDTVTYKDGTSEEVYGFDIPVPALDEEFDVAIIGEKGEWYDHKVSVSSPK